MSDPGAPLTGSSAVGGQAAGAQAQFGLLLQLMQKIVDSLTGGGGGASTFFNVQPFVAAGNLDIAAAFPLAKSGIFSIRKTVPAITTVILPAFGGPWAVVDGAGNAGTYPITVVGAGGTTILGAASDTLAFNWQFKTYVLDGNNFVIGL